MIIMVIISMILSIILIIFTYLINKNKTYIDKRSTIESGFESIEDKIGLDRKEQHYISFYIIGIIFIIFDLEVVLLYPIGSLFSYLYQYNNLNLYLIFFLFLFFTFFMILGLYYESHKKVL